jgi:UDP-N-acetyl-D-glucosamine dehydrogenase
MPSYIVSRIIEMMNSLEKPMNNSNILILGVAYKKDISDTRESPSINIIENLHSKGVNVSYYDPFVDSLKLNAPIKKEEDIKNFNNYDLILFHTAHTEFSQINFEEIDVPIFDATGTGYVTNSERI